MGPEAFGLKAVNPVGCNSRPRTMHRLLATTLLCLALPAAAQAVPQINWSDMWYDTAESGWGLSFTQHAGTNQVYAVWYTYDPRDPDPSLPGRFMPLWLVMPGGVWESSTRISGQVYALTGTAVTLPWRETDKHLDVVGTFTIQFNDGNSGTFTYDVKPPAGAASGSPAFNLPAMSGSKPIVRQGF